MMDEDLQRMLSELVEALEAVVVAIQVERSGGAQGTPASGYSLMEAVRRVNLVRRSISQLSGGAPPGGEPGTPR